MISFRPFREMIKEKRITTYYLRNKCGKNNIDHKTLKSLMNDESVTINTINSLCNIFKCSFSDLMEHIPDQYTDDTYTK